MVSSVTVGGTSPDFKTIKLFLDAVPDELDDVYRANVRAGLYEDTLVVSSSNRLTIDGPASAIQIVAEDWHTGTSGTGVMISTSATSTAIDNYNPNTLLEGLEISGSTANKDGLRQRGVGASGLTLMTIRRCLIYNFNHNGAEGLFIGATTSGIINVESTIFWDCKRSAILMNTTTNPMAINLNLNNITMYNCGRSSWGGILIRSTHAETKLTVSAVNCLFHSSNGSSIAIDETNDSGDFGFNLQYVIDNDGSSEVSSTGTSNNVSGNIGFEVSGGVGNKVFVRSINNRDFHLHDAAINIARGSGKVIRPYLEYDIDGDWRRVPFDIGADQTDSNSFPFIGRRQIIID